MAITAKIKWDDFPLTYNLNSPEEVTKEFWIKVDSKGFIDVVVWYDGSPSEDTLAQVKRYYCTDIYAPEQKDPEDPSCNRYDTKSVEVAKLKCITQSK